MQVGEHPGSAPKERQDPVADRFQARNEANEVVFVEQLKTTAEENSLGGLEWAGPGVRYRLVDGSEVERIDDSHFRVVHNGEIVRRVEGDHGITTHHLEHQTPSNR